LFFFSTIHNLDLQLAIEESLDFYSWHVNSDSNTLGRSNLNNCGPTELATMLSIGTQECSKNKKQGETSVNSDMTADIDADHDYETKYYPPHPTSPLAQKLCESINDKKNNKLLTHDHICHHCNRKPPSNDLANSGNVQITNEHHHSTFETNNVASTNQNYNTTLTGSHTSNNEDNAHTNNNNHDDHCLIS
jgi:hypothetical protein